MLKDNGGKAVKKTKILLFSQYQGKMNFDLGGRGNQFSKMKE